MNRYLTRATAALIAGATLMLCTASANAASVDVNIGIPLAGALPQAVWTQPRPLYVQPQYETDWRERRIRAAEWRANPNHRGQALSAGPDGHKHKHKGKNKKHHGKKKHGH